MRTAVVLLGLSLVIACSAKVPDFIKICKRGSPSINDCVKDSANSIIPYLVKGVPALRIPPIDPFFVPRFVIDKGDGPVTLKLDLTNQNCIGLGNIQFTSASLDSKTHTMVLKANLPEFDIVGDYKANGRILLLPITGNGDGSTNLTNVDTVFTIKTHPVKKNGAVHLELDEFIVSVDPKRVYIRLNNLFNGDRVLGETMNNFMNENWSDIFNELRSSYEEVFGQLFGSATKRFLDKYTYEELFPTE